MGRDPFAHTHLVPEAGLTRKRLNFGEEDEGRVRVYLVSRVSCRDAGSACLAATAAAGAGAAGRTLVIS